VADTPAPADRPGVRPDHARTKTDSPDMRWLRRLRGPAHAADAADAGRADGTGRLVFFPAAGSNAASAWALTAAVPAGWSVWGVQYPARGPRLLEPAARSVREIAATCLPTVAVEHDRTVLFGHSFGALVAYDMAQMLEQAGMPAAGLVVAGSSAPAQAPEALRAAAGGSAGARVDELSDAALIAFLTGRGGTPPHLLANDELMRLALPALRADLALGQSYVDDHGRRLGTAILALGGRRDPSVSSDQLCSWQHRTNAWLGQALSEGGHFFYLQDSALISAALHRYWPAGRREDTALATSRTGPDPARHRLQRGIG
jgi:surfactin synthase thioesterase subunit